jgi:serine/threonine-protein kinase
MPNTPPPQAGQPAQGGQRMQVAGKVANPYQALMPQPGSKVGPNRIEQIVGEGGMANVYKIWNESLEVVRALKILKQPGIREARERFLTEAKILADIRHPNIVEIYSIGVLNQQVPFIEMEYIDGMSVKKLIAQNARISVPAALAIAYPVCQALQYAHTKDYTLYGNIYHGLIHRDIKPDNIIIARDGQIKLMDFGIARPSEVSLHTVGAKIMGTLVYLSPEQLNGTELDHRSDIFSMGTVLYEMITGVRAYPQKTLSELVQAKTKGMCPPITSHGVSVPKELAETVEKAMALEPNERFDTAADLARKLYEIMISLTDLSPPDIIMRYTHDPSTRFERPRRKGAGVPWWVTAALGAVAAALLAAVIVLAVA